MDAFELSDLVVRQAASGRPYLEFITVPDLSVGLYVLKAGEPDLQRPHTEDEVYYVISGRATVRVDGQDSAVSPGSVVFVGARADHRFHSISERLELLVVFAPAESG
jgi:mannose-6-phosphate isomerase-like protein (cupin superfamily)